MDTNNKISEDEEFSFDWKKNGVGTKEHLTLKNNVKEALKYNEEKKSPLAKNKKINPENLPLGLQKIRKKIREIYDDEDDEDEDTIFAHIKMPEQEEDNILLNSLNDDEKRIYHQQNTIENTRMQQISGKMEALHIANNLAREAGLKNISRKAIDAGMQQATFEPEKMQEQVIKKEVGGKLGIKGKIEDGKIIQAARGIKKVEQLGGKQATQNLNMKDIVKAGEQKLSDIELAEMILEKSGQDVKKRKNNLKKAKDNIELKHFKQPEQKHTKNINQNKNSNFGR
ncbi:MAG: hypothetical protein IJ019_02880 [Alphaproteobacteria bacterium]|nr:hypothetical protein [Alphaproteobacteria bacterium]